MNNTLTSFNHKNGQMVFRPLSGAKYSPYQVVAKRHPDNGHAKFRAVS